MRQNRQDPKLSDQNKLPQHIAIVMDGNGRWAENRNLPRISGHEAGVGVVRKITQYCSQLQIKVLTLFAFSTENWSRPPAEVKFLMRLFLQKLASEAKGLHNNNVQLRIIGDIAGLDSKLQERISKAMQLTAKNTGLQLVIALNYSGRWDITQALQQIGALIEQKKITSAEINAALIQNYLCLADLPEPDLFIRTSGEIRISNFMLWQLAYSELYFTDILWPDFDEAALDKALSEYAKRHRRFGKV